MKIRTLLLLFLTSSVFSQKTNKIVTILDKNLKEIENLIKFSQIKLELSTFDKKPFNANDSKNFENINPTKEINKQKIQTFLDSLETNYSLFYPYSFINIRTRESELLEILNKDSFYYMHNPSKKPEFIAQSIVYRNGNTSKIKNYITPDIIEKKYTVVNKQTEEISIDTLKMTAFEKAVWEEKSSFNTLIGIESHKPIKSISYHVKVPIPTYTLAYLEKVNDSIKTKAGYIKLVAMANNKVVLNYPSKLDDSLEINALYKNDKILKNKNSSSNTLISKEQYAKYQAYILAIKEAKKQVLLGKIKSEEEVEKFFESKFPKNQANETTNEVSYTQKSITFSGPVSKILIRLPDEKQNTQQYNVTHHFKQDKDEEYYIVASDFKSNKTGILATNGEWIIEPKHDTHFRMCNPYFFTDQINDTNNIYHFNPKTKKLTKKEYLLDNYEIYENKYVKIRLKTNGLIGVADALTGEIIIPVEYQYLHLANNNLWIARNQDDKTGVLDADFKTILPFDFFRIEYDNNYFYTTKVVGKKEIQDIYDYKGNNLTLGKYQEINQYNEGRALVKTVTITKNNYYTTTGLYFIDEKGELVTNLYTSGYDDAYDYRNDLAAVRNKKNNLYGFINRSGKLVLACNYKGVSIGFFKQSGLAPVQLANNTYALVDKTGKVVKTFPSSFSVVNYNGDGKNMFLLVNQVWYDDYGNKVVKK